jgi:hypothetical protein
MREQQEQLGHYQEAHLIIADIGIVHSDPSSKASLFKYSVDYTTTPPLPYTNKLIKQ